MWPPQWGACRTDLWREHLFVAQAQHDTRRRRTVGGAPGEDIINWLIRLKNFLGLEQTAQARPKVTTDDFDAFLTTRLTSAQAAINDIFDQFDVSTLPENVTRLHIEVFDEIRLDLRVFGFDAGSVQVRDPQHDGVTPHAGLAGLNAALDRVLPLVNQQDLDRFTIWEQHPKFGRQEALWQPLDDYDAWGHMRPFLSEVTAGLRASFPGDFTIGLHDR